MRYLSILLFMGTITIVLFFSHYLGDHFLWLGNFDDFITYLFKGSKELLASNTTNNTDNLSELISSFEKIRNNTVKFKPTELISIESLQAMLDQYWLRIRTQGFGVKEVDEIVVFITVSRVFILTIRYNVRTSLLITVISILAGYIWYTTFLSTIFRYEELLYGNALTLRLGIDSMQIRRMFEGKMEQSNYQIRITNPVGILLYSIGMGSVYEGHRIDPGSMIVANILKYSDKIPSFISYHLESTYYFIYRKLLPTVTRTTLNIFDAFKSYIVYTMITRVGKKYCPYLIRWHWTFIMLIKFFDNFLFSVVGRLNYYSMNTLYPQVYEREAFNLSVADLNFEIQMLYYMSYTIIIAQLFILLYGMLHALAGQYFYTPFFTRTVELNIGERNKLDIYSGGQTAWQDEDFLTRGYKGFKIKFWYGWFGRGTDNPNDILPTIGRFIWRLIKKLIKKLTFR
nr:hypothetical protein [Thalassionema bacillare]UHY41048.1 hypothetical protein [Thalassionema bacillare]